MGYYAEILQDSRKRKKTIFLTPDDFLTAVIEYFQWCEDNPILEEQVNVWQGNVIRTDLSKVRAFTKQGLATYLGIPRSRLDSYKERKDPAWAEVIEQIEQVIYTQKFENAAAGLLNSNIIIRDLGLTEKSQTEVSAPGGGAPVTFNIMPVASGTFLPPEQEDQAEDSVPSEQTTA